ncbi:hypothetical protein AVEN_94293-1 [Araneus ventricosus]|uniref:Uncharacterized protein n=1 Tax=Araneus ventricosus TaxID=182803 RepID=A0A4Y2I7Y7_ARAVE|nr:hypothetical protein AVEN_94293-1 [Araneus ventricosus]
MQSDVLDFRQAIHLFQNLPVGKEKANYGLKEYGSGIKEVCTEFDRQNLTDGKKQSQDNGDGMEILTALDSLCSDRAHRDKEERNPHASTAAVDEHSSMPFSISLVRQILYGKTSASVAASAQGDLSGAVGSAAAVFIDSGKSHQPRQKQACRRIGSDASVGAANEIAY